jgi:hypothetical protein
MNAPPRREFDHHGPTAMKATTIDSLPELEKSRVKPRDQDHQNRLFKRMIPTSYPC